MRISSSPWKPATADIKMLMNLLDRVPVCTSSFRGFCTCAILRHYLSNRQVLERPVSSRASNPLALTFMGISEVLCLQIAGTCREVFAPLVPPGSVLCPLYNLVNVLAGKGFVVTLSKTKACPMPGPECFYNLQHTCIFCGGSHTEWKVRAALHRCPFALTSSFTSYENSCRVATSLCACCS